MDDTMTVVLSRHSGIPLRGKGVILEPKVKFCQHDVEFMGGALPCRRLTLCHREVPEG